MGLGSLAGGVFILEPARKRLKPNQMTILGGIALAVVYALMAVIRHPQVFFLVAALAEASHFGAVFSYFSRILRCFTEKECA
jgi:Na+/melibiose symporter-like transporter